MAQACTYIHHVCACMYACFELCIDVFHGTSIYSTSMHVAYIHQMIMRLWWKSYVCMYRCALDRENALHAWANTCPHTYAHSHTYAHISTHIVANTCPHTYAHTHTYAHLRAHMCLSSTPYHASNKYAKHTCICVHVFIYNYIKPCTRDIDVLWLRKKSCDRFTIVCVCVIVWFQPWEGMPHQKGARRSCIDWMAIHGVLYCVRGGYNAAEECDTRYVCVYVCMYI